MNPWSTLDARSLGEHLRRREVSALEATRCCLARIERLNPTLNAVVRVNPRAEEDACDADRLQRPDPPALTGIPVVVKDNLNTTGIETTCGSRILSGFVPPRDATVVSRLRKAGAVIAAKTNMDEFGMGSSTESSAFGPCRNPWDLDRVPGGSSGGSAAAVAAGMAPIALGSDTGGSVRQPAALCGVVGLKPTYGRVSRSGLVAFGSSLDQVGPLARTVADAALALECIAGPDPEDMTCATRPIDDYVGACHASIEGLRVGWPREYYESGLDDEIHEALRAAADELEQLGARVDEVSLPRTRFAIPTYYLIATAEASSNLARFDGVRYGQREDPDHGLRAMYGASRSRGFGAEVQRRIMLGTYALSAGYRDAFYGRAQSARRALRRDFLCVFERDIDVLLTPTTPTTAFRLGEVWGDPLAMYLSDVYTVTASLVGIPALVVPVGLDRAGLPIGAQLMGPDFSETTLLRVGAALESRHRLGAAPAGQGLPR